MFKSTVGKTFTKLVVGTSVFYAGGVALALQNNAFNELFTDNVPFAEEAVDFVESLTTNTNKDYNIQNFKKKFGELEKTFEIPKSGLFSTKIDSVKEKEEALSDKVKQAVAKVKDTVSTTSFPSASYKLPLLELKSENQDVQNAITEFNAFITKINNGELNHAIDFGALSELFTKLDNEIKSLQDTSSKVFDEKVQKGIEGKANEVLADFNKRFDAKVKEIEDHHNAQLATEVSLNKQVSEKEFANRAKLIAIDAQKASTDAVAKVLEEEREGKYANFVQLNKSLEDLQTLVLQLDHHLDNADLKVQLQYELNKIRTKLDSEKNVQFSQELAELKKLAQEADNKVIVNAVDAIDPKAASEGLLTPSQLITRFNLLAPELRTAALLPPNAGVLGHLGAKFFAFFLLSKAGDVEGKDIESVIARVQNNLVTNRLDDAVEEVANLKGWSRTLADDWLVESRKRLEVEFLVKVIDLECKSLY
ncbi:unnamed protein product [Cyberlindnera jadinii]|uniref:MICOS complex subunit MIC60 n=1 Tax=Cyberlindnera jadinii (strain ATCC 18201 / CBS 1600 / BCRC 20928 / JCM 3617 / NBRC 0987 / NRRL Y-1542) TaxID=983966 RepID=A0A0H5C308_CYBJN|nr:hypothetical protein CYBJADRAFT_188374 [Cyberlindnera jadinii NRRL Y-1542]ODV75221.1 hypothetical protein CYBJADRAFT_188374 [Cyberlindnera jadinii NRRL Y-1542]CEP22380.1 unnamed protein product [Cyberlindnera jadinii]